MVTCADAVEEAVNHYGGVVTSRQVFDYINKNYPSKPWKDNTIRCHFMGCTVNHSSSHHYRHFRKNLFAVRPGQVRLYDPQNDGHWKWTSDGMIKIDNGDESEEDVPEEVDDSTEVDSSLISFHMERDLELFLYNDITALDTTLDLPSELENRQYSVSSGRIDILAKDSEDNFVVIELKAGIAKDQTLTQLLAYMTDINSQFDTRNVRGMIVAHDFSEKLVKASKLVPSIKLMKYNISFGFEPV